MAEMDHADWRFTTYLHWQPSIKLFSNSDPVHRQFMCTAAPESGVQTRCYGVPYARIKNT